MDDLELAFERLCKQAADKPALEETCKAMMLVLNRVRILELKLARLDASVNRGSIADPTCD